MVKLFIGQLPEGCTSSDLRTLFEPLGEISECERLTNKPYGFVHFEDDGDARSAIAALHETEFMGRRITVEMSNSKVRQQPGMGQEGECYKCGKQGHWSKNCPNRDMSGRGRGMRGGRGGGRGRGGGYSNNHNDGYMGGGGAGGAQSLFDIMHEMGPPPRLPPLDPRDPRDKMIIDRLRYYDTMFDKAKGAAPTSKPYQDPFDHIARDPFMDRQTGMGGYRSRSPLGMSMYDDGSMRMAGGVHSQAVF